MGFSESEKVSGVSDNKLLNISWSNRQLSMPLAWGTLNYQIFSHRNSVTVLVFVEWYRKHDLSIPFTFPQK